MACQEPATDFSLHFNSLPAEIRQMIWKEAALTSMENPELLILVPRSVRLGMYSANKSTPLPPVNTAFPAVMHVNREARHIALMYTKMIDIGPYPWGKCLVPQRPFRPDIDTLYVSRTHNPAQEFRSEDMEKVQHLALDMTEFITTGLTSFFAYKSRQMPALRTLRIVLPSARADLDLSAPPCLPHRRCALRTIKSTPPTAFLSVEPYTRELYAREFTSILASRVANSRLSRLSRPSRPVYPSSTPPPPLNTMQFLQSLEKPVKGPLPFDRTLKNYVINAEWTKLEREMRAQELQRVAARAGITTEVCLITEFCYSPSGDSGFVAVGEKFPDSPDPSTFASLNASRCTKNLLSIL
ncbi:hypothetical protein GGS24DRAFT_380463 [Hypoxylon argillaceum]|nr:hypothetical protein GGS24DRAFT_380463 [Hypoxylon argillaceum]